MLSLSTLPDIAEFKISSISIPSKKSPENSFAFSIKLPTPKVSFCSSIVSSIVSLSLEFALLKSPAIHCDYHYANNCEYGFFIIFFSYHTIFLLFVFGNMLFFN